MAALLGGTAAGAGGSQQPAAKRRCLRHYDLVPAQLLNPMGESGIEKIGIIKRAKMKSKMTCDMSNRC